MTVHQVSISLRPSLLLSCLAILLSLPALGAPVSPWQAERAVQAWLAADADPLGAPMGGCVAGVEAHAGYYVVRLSPNGFALVAADDRVEPIIAFSPDGEFDPSSAGPLEAMVSGDLSARMAAVQRPRRTVSPVFYSQVMDATRKWRRLLGFSTLSLIYSPSDERVPPIIDSKWSQETVARDACYNYYTPPHSSGVATNYPCGCVATAMAQVMRHFRHPVQAVGAKSFQIKVDNVSKTRSLVGGDGAGGAYDYDSMVAQPNWSTTDEQRQAIGAICHDAGVASLTSYDADGSSASFTDAQKALKETFGYSNVIFGYNSAADIGSGLNGMINPNLDAGLPVILALGGAAEGHAVVCDGYGYNYSTLYHHLNMGWAGEGDIWYNLPTVKTSVGDYRTVEQCLYNIFTTGTGEIISGRVLNSSSQPIEGATVVGMRVGVPTLNDKTSGSGVYALPAARSGTSYTVIACAPGCVFSSRTASTGRSADFAKTSGNLSGIDLIAQAGWRGPTDEPAAIPDGNPSGLEVSFYINDAGVVSDLDVAVSILHGRESDVSVYLISPGGGSITLLSGVGGTGVDFLNTILDDEASSAVASGSAPFAGSYRPAQALSALDGTPAAGVWKLRVVDSVDGTTGTLVSWCLRMTVVADTQPPTCTVTAPASPTTISPIDFAVEFSEPVSLASQLPSLTGGTLVSWLGSGKSYTVRVRPTGYGTVTCRIPAGAATDASGNPNTASNTASVVYQAALPLIRLSQPTYETTFGRTCADVSLAGTASDYDGITTVFWSDGTTGGLCSGTTSWEVDLTLQPGRNTITIFATDGQGDTGELVLTIDRIEPDPGDAWSGLAMVSLPSEPDKTDPKIVAGFDGNYWLGYCLNMGGYVQYPDSWLWFGGGNPTPGRGFWARFPDAGTAFSLSGTVPRQDQPYTIHLQPGWNIIGNPFVSPVAWSTSAIQVRATGYAQMPLSQASALVASYLWGWNNATGEYYLVCDPSTASGQVTSIQPWQGYWIKAKAPCDLIIPAP